MEKKGRGRNHVGRSSAEVKHLDVSKSAWGGTRD